jgi:hypothetical protein
MIGDIEWRKMATLEEARVGARVGREEEEGKVRVPV